MVSTDAVTDSSGRKASAPLRVAVVEDDAVMRVLLEYLLSKAENEFDLLGLWKDGESALRDFPELVPDVVVVDLELPRMTGAQLISSLATKLPHTAFVVLTVHDDPLKVFDALRAGARGYLLKGSNRGELVTCIRAASEGVAPLSQEIANLLIQSFQEPAKVEKRPIPGLTPREMQILERLAQGMVPKEVAFDLSLSYETVRDYLKGVYLKLHVRSRTEAVIKYLQHGEP